MPSKNWNQGLSLVFFFCLHAVVVSEVVKTVGDMFFGVNWLHTVVSFGYMHYYAYSFGHTDVLNLM